VSSYAKDSKNQETKVSEMHTRIVDATLQNGGLLAALSVFALNIG
jgi:hypothetical protein